MPDPLPGLPTAAATIQKPPPDAPETPIAGCAKPARENENAPMNVLLVPVQYYIFGSLAEGKSLVHDEAERTVTHEATHHV